MFFDVVPALHFGERPKDAKITGAVIHYTAGGSGRGLAKWWQNPKSRRVSAHVIGCRDGHPIMCVPLEKKALHAGEVASKGLWKNKPQPENVNNFTVGLENANYGVLKKVGRGFLTGGGNPYRGPEPVCALDHRGNERWWEPYTDELIQLNVRFLRYVGNEFAPDMTREDVQAHSDVSPHRKFDPGPLYPWDYVLGEVFGSGGGKTSYMYSRARVPDDTDFSHRVADVDDEMCVIEPIP